MKLIRSVSVLTLCIVLISCSALPRSWRRKNHFPPEYLRSENPVEQVKAIHELVENSDKQHMPQLFDLMLNEEPSVRNHAFWGVTQLTGVEKPINTNIMYHYYDSVAEREKAVESWREYWKSIEPQKPQQPDSKN